MGHRSCAFQGRELARVQNRCEFLSSFDLAPWHFREVVFSFNLAWHTFREHLVAVWLRVGSADGSGKASLDKEEQALVGFLLVELPVGALESTAATGWQHSCLCPGRAPVTPSWGWCGGDHGGQV